MYDLYLLAPHSDMKRITIFFNGGLLPYGRFISRLEEYNLFLTGLSNQFGRHKLIYDEEHKRKIYKFENENVYLGLLYYGSAILSFTENEIISKIFIEFDKLPPLENYHRYDRKKKIWIRDKNKRKFNFKSTEISFDYCIPGKDYIYHKNLMIAMANMIRPKEKGNFQIYFLLGEFEYLDNGEINGDLTIYWNKLSYRDNRKIKEQVATHVTRGYKVYCKFMSNQWWIRFEVILYDEGTKEIIEFFNKRSIFRINPLIEDKRFSNFFEFVYVDIDGYKNLLNEYHTISFDLSAYRSSPVVEKEYWMRHAANELNKRRLYEKVDKFITPFVFEFKP